MTKARGKKAIHLFIYYLYWYSYSYLCIFEAIYNVYYKAKIFPLKALDKTQEKFSSLNGRHMIRL